MEIAAQIFPVVVLLALGIVAAVLSRMARINPIVGYLLLGVGLAATHPDLLAAGGAVHLLAELGVVFLLFDIGLHFSIAHVRQEAGDIFGFGPLQVVSASALLGGGAWLLGIPLLGALLAGTALSLSSTAIVASVIAERKQQNCPVALTATAILIFQDVAAIFLLIVATALDQGGALPVLLAAAGKTVVAVAITLVAALYLVRPLFRILSKHGGEEVFTATALFIALAAGWAAAAVGLSMTLGAFLGGMMVAESPFRASVRSEIGPFRGLLVSFFFISVGASLDLSSIVGALPAIIALSVLMVVAKSFANMGASLAFRWSVPGSVQLGVLLAGGSEFAFVIFALPSVRSAIGQPAVTNLIAVVAVTLAATPALGFVGRNIAGRLRLSASSKQERELVPVGETNPVLIIGIGEVGRTVADALEEFEIGYDAIERDDASLRAAIADGYNVFHGDHADARMWRSVDLNGRRFSIMTAATPQQADDWLPSSQALFPAVRRLWVATSPEDAERYHQLGLETVIARDRPKGIEAAQYVLRAFDVDEPSIARWTDQQQARIADPLAA